MVAHSGTKCAATVLNGDYPVWADTRLERIPSFVVPDASQNPRFRFWYWFSFAVADYGIVQIKPVGSANWLNISAQINYTSSNTWSYHSVDLSAYSGQAVQIALRFVAVDGASGYDQSSGWYIDDASLITGPYIFNNPESFEDGFGDWYVDGGTWGVGVPTSGPNSAHSGQKCVSTNLAGDYDTWVDSRLISPIFTVPAASLNPRFRFWYWFSFAVADYGIVQIKSVGSSNWVNISAQINYTSSNTWSYHSIDLSAYSGQAVQIALRFVAVDGASGYDQSSGWYIDDASLITGPYIFNNPESFEDGFGDWYVDGGTWGVGVPTSGPNSAHSGQKCVSTNLAGDYDT